MRRELLVIVAALAVFGITGRLGWWQLDRAAEKQSVQATLDARSALPPLDAGALADTAPAAESQYYRKVSVSGRWLDARTVFLDNRPIAGNTGFIVVTPLALDSGKAVLVQRGWVKRNFDERAALPRFASADRVTVDGPWPPGCPGLRVLGGSNRAIRKI